MPKSVAVIDLGTNTFNIIIAEKTDNQIHYLFRDRKPVLLGKDGIHKGIITNEALSRAENVLVEFKKIIGHYKVHDILIIGTSAIRTASNAPQLNAVVYQLFGVNIQIISGNEEANYIYHGIKQTISSANEPFLIVDIGGGSNELIVADQNGIIYKNSFPIGMARVLAQFSFSDPITAAEQKELEKYFNTELANFFEAISMLEIKTLIGAEGAFESFATMAVKDFGYELMLNSLSGNKALFFPINLYFSIHDYLIHSTIEKRKTLQGLEPHRVEMIIPATVFVNYLIEKCSISNLYVSPFSLKEGVAWQYFFN